MGELQLDPENLLSSRNSIKLLSYITPATLYNKSGLLPHYCPWGMLLTSNHSFFSEVFNLGIPQFISLRKRQSLVITFLNLNLLIMVRKTQQCSQCEYKATTKSNIQAHVKSVHEGHKFSCPHCGLTFIRKGNLHVHIKSVHEGEKFPCSHCKSTFTQKGNLKTHIKSVHEGFRKKQGKSNMKRPCNNISNSCNS